MAAEGESKNQLYFDANISSSCVTLDLKIILVIAWATEISTWKLLKPIHPNRKITECNGTIGVNRAMRELNLFHRRNHSQAEVTECIS